MRPIGRRSRAAWHREGARPVLELVGDDLSAIGTVALWVWRGPCSGKGVDFVIALEKEACAVGAVLLFVVPAILFTLPQRAFKLEPARFSAFDPAGFSFPRAHAQWTRCVTAEFWQCLKLWGSSLAILKLQL